MTSSTSPINNNRKYFGTDGIRGKANTYPMTGETALKVGMAAGKYFTRGKRRHYVVIGKDTRLSGYMIEPSLTAGFISMGMNVYLVGPLPTPAISMLTKSMRCDVGVMISASHNLYEDNGIKLFGPDGNKLSDENEIELEHIIDRINNLKLVESKNLGRATRIDDAAGRYLEFVKSTFPVSLSLKNIKIVLDCANGAAYQVAPRALWELGAEVITIGCSPNGTNINDKCGSTYPKLMAEEVKNNNANIGIALDGDADRCIISDEKGNFIDGDLLLGIITKRYLDKKLLNNNIIVGTQMTNKGLENYLNSLDLKLIRTAVGDRYVIKKMKKHNSNIGGEQSGHIILGDYNSTGDGLVAALQIIACMKEQNVPASFLGKKIKLLPQVIESISYSILKIETLNEDRKIKEEIMKAEHKLGKSGRIFIRPSGTEKKIRIMAECEKIDLLDQTIKNLKTKISALIKKHEKN